MWKTQFSLESIKISPHFHSNPEGNLMKCGSEDVGVTNVKGNRFVSGEGGA